MMIFVLTVYDESGHALGRMYLDDSNDEKCREKQEGFHVGRLGQFLGWGKSGAARNQG